MTSLFDFLAAQRRFVYLLVGLLSAGGIYAALRLPSGKHQVRFEYHSTYLSRGWAIALGAVLILGAYAAVRRSRKTSGAA